MKDLQKDYLNRKKKNKERARKSPWKLKDNKDRKDESNKK